MSENETPDPNFSVEKAPGETAEHVIYPSEAPSDGPREEEDANKPAELPAGTGSGDFDNGA